MRKMIAVVALAVWTGAPALADDKCLTRVDVSKATGTELDGFVATLCDGPAGTLLERAVITDTLFAANGDDTLVDRVLSKEITDDEMYAMSAKAVHMEFNAGSIIAFSNAKLRDRIERYMTRAYASLFSQGLPLRLVRIVALYPMSDGTDGVIYNTVIWNDEGLYGPGNLPSSWETLWLHLELRE